MSGSRRMVALAIGVAAADPLDYLPAALNGAQGFHDWAAAMGYEATLLTDARQPVTVARLQAAFEAILPPRGPAIHRLLLYFAGHGLIRDADEGLWLLSDWYVEQRAVSVDGLRRKLYRFGIGQIGVFADACRSLPPDMEAADLTAEKVLRLGPKPLLAPAIDRFVASQDGAKSYSVPGAAPEQDRCIFTGVLLEGLWGISAGAFSRVEARRVVTGRSLGTFLQAEVANRALRYRRSLTPSVSASFPEGEDVYFGDRDPAPAVPAFAAWPAPESLLDAAPPPRAAVAPPADTLLRRIEAQERTDHHETGSGLAVQGAPVAAVWTPPAVLAETAGRPDWWRLRPRNESRLRDPAPVLVELLDGRFAAPVALPSFIGALTCDPRGVCALIYREVYAPGDIAAVTEQVVARMEGGGLRADAASDLAVELRQLKHADPVRGAISAYLYDSIGDQDSIRRMAYFYVRHGQPIPYDIALLAGVSGSLRNGALWAAVPAVPARVPRTEAEAANSWTHEATPAVSGAVGGLWPWMRQGWTLLDDPRADGSTLVLPGVMDLAGHLLPARFTGFDRAGGLKLAETFGLTAIWHI